jgi:hypothetical protein
VKLFILSLQLSLPLLHTDPEVWFIESSHGMVTKTSEEGTIPCVVTNPQINVTLYETDSNMHLKGVYIPSEGYRASLEDRTYVCRGELKGEEKESQEFYVLSIVGGYLEEAGGRRWGWYREEHYCLLKPIACLFIYL